MPFFFLSAASALLVGLSKTGLPVLLTGDLFAVAWFWQHADWGRLVRLLPYVLAGMLPGVLVLRSFEGNRLRPIIGALVLVMLAIETYRQWLDWEHMPHRWWFTAAATLAPVTILGALFGAYVLARIPQRFFDVLALALAGVAA